MPELPEVEAVVRKLRREALGAAITGLKFARPNVIAPQDPAEVEQAVAGTRLESAERRAKHIFLGLSGNRILRVHLGMTGNLVVIPDFRFRPASARAWIEFQTGAGIVLDDPRNLGRMRLHSKAEADAIIRKLGVEPLSPQFTLDSLLELTAQSRLEAKLFLMDQRFVAGLGNIYAAEALFLARIHPQRPVSALKRPKLAALHAAIRDVLERAVDSAAAAYAAPGAFREGEWFECAVYRREGKPCPRCGKPIRRIEQGGRSTYFCGSCQR